MEEEEFIIDSEHWVLVDISTKDLVMDIYGSPCVFETELEAKDFLVRWGTFYRFTPMQAKSLLPH
jgi:hypothetical protein